MARRRMIDPSIWQNEAFAGLGARARLLYIGMFSQADDEGRGRARPVYLRSSIFPYDEDLPVAEVEAALDEVARRMGVVLYQADGACYYAFANWGSWQRVDRPQKSMIPPPPGFFCAESHSRKEGEACANESGEGGEACANGSSKGGEACANDSCAKEKKGKEEKKKERKAGEGAGARAGGVKDGAAARDGGAKGPPPPGEGKSTDSGAAQRAGRAEGSPCAEGGSPCLAGETPGLAGGAPGLETGGAFRGAVRPGAHSSPGRDARSTSGRDARSISGRDARSISGRGDNPFLRAGL